ncbi:MAG: ferritin-like domain-containing protein [Trueperaceae bacterium]
MKTDFSRLFKTSMNRRQMLGNLGMMSAGAALTACAGVVAQPEDQERDVDAAILTFALNLEYLEAAFYLAAVGRLSELPGGDAAITLPSGFDGSTAVDFGAGGANATASTALRAYAEELANEELAHTEFLRGALTDAGVTVDRPMINLASSFQAAAAAAFEGVDPATVGLPADFTPDDFDPFASGAFFAHGAFIFEDVGVSAYKGAAPLIINSDYLAAAAGILASEAYHAGNIRTFLHLGDTTLLDFYNGLNTHAITQAISDTRDELDGTADQDQGIANVAIETGGDANIAVTSSDGIAFGRTPAQVAAIVYLSAEAMVSSSSFFPEGINTANLDDDFAYLLAL